jgi:hypothetical protein
MANLRRRFDWLTTEGTSFDTPEIGRSHQRDISRQATGLIDVLYALVLVQGADSYHLLFVEGDRFLQLEHWLPVVLALVLIYFTAVQSFIDFHMAAEDRPYRLLDTRHKNWDLARFYLDLVIVGSYSFLLLKCHTLLTNPGADLLWVFLTLPAIFVLYLLWGGARNPTTSDLPYSPRLLTASLASYVLLLLAYRALPAGWITNAACLGAALMLMGLYRWLNWDQNKRLA